MQLGGTPGSSDSSINATRLCVPVRQSRALRQEIPGFKAANIGLGSWEARLQGGRCAAAR